MSSRYFSVLVDRALHRTQMELVGSRTSLLNECFL